jgi:hypothetical protein
MRWRVNRRLGNWGDCQRELKSSRRMLQNFQKQGMEHGIGFIWGTPRLVGSQKEDTGYRQPTDVVPGIPKPQNENGRN